MVKVKIPNLSFLAVTFVSFNVWFTLFPVKIQWLRQLWIPKKYWPLVTRFQWKIRPEKGQLTCESRRVGRKGYWGKHFLRTISKWIIRKIALYFIWNHQANYQASNSESKCTAFRLFIRSFLQRIYQNPWTSSVNNLFFSLPQSMPRITMEDSSGSPGNKSRVIPHKHKTLNPRHRG